MISRALLLTASLVLGACASTTSPPPASVAATPAIVERASARDFMGTLADFKAAATARGFTIFAEIDHAANAAGVGASLPPSTLILFGNPKGGTPLIAAAPTVAIDLPLRALVYQSADGAKVTVATPDIDRLFDAHGLSAETAAKEKIKAAVAAIAEAATDAE